MAWFKVDDGFYTSKKVLMIPRQYRNEAVGAWLMLGAWSADKMTDGIVPSYVVDDFSVSDEALHWLIEVGLWDRTDDGIEYHDWCEYQPTRDQLESRNAEKSAKRREAGIKSGEVRRTKREQNRTKDEQNGNKIEQTLNPEPEPDINTLTSETEVSTIDDFSDDVKELTDYLAERIRANGNKVGAVGVRWWQACDRLLRVDERDPDEVRQVIDWCQKNEFWQGNILSMPKLREKYDTLRNQMNRDGVMKTKPKDYNPADYSRIKGWGFRYEDQQ